MGISLSIETWEKRKNNLLKYLKKHPETNVYNLIEDGIYWSTLHKSYGCSINRAREDAGITKRYGRVFSEKTWEERLKRLIVYILKHPYSTSHELEQAKCAPAVNKLFGGIIELRKELGIDFYGTVSPAVWEKRRINLSNYLKRKPNAMLKDIMKNGHHSALRKFYDRSITKARKDLGMDDSLEKILTNE